MIRLDPVKDRFAWMAFAPANPVFFLSLSKDPEQHQIAREIVEFLSSRSLWGDPELVGELWQESVSKLGKVPQPKVRKLIHCFPVFVPNFQNGMLVPLEIAPAEDWAASDAFGSFELPEPGGSPLERLMNLLNRVQEPWRELGRRTALPLRWRRAFSLSIASPLHFEAIEGKSLQVPLLVALLRELCALPSTATSPRRLPFGEGPVFCSGRLLDHGYFGRVEHFEEKLEGFLREAGPNQVALLTTDQYKDLKRSGRTRRILGQLDLRIAGDIKKLLRLPDFREGLKWLAGAPHITEIDALLGTLLRLQRTVRFSDAMGLSQWLEPHVKNPPYRLSLLLQLGSLFLHRGRYVEAGRFLKPVEAILEDPRAELGLDERIDAASDLATWAFDTSNPDYGLALLMKEESRLHLCSPSSRVRALGSLCQLHRLAGNLDEAVRCGREAVRQAQHGVASEAARDMNYLVHALLRRAAARKGAQRETDLREATDWLEQSQGKWARVDNERARNAHLGFCLHYQAELARLQRKRFRPPDAPPWWGDWGHPWLFVLLSCSRNKAHSAGERREYARRLLDASSEKKKKFGGLFEMFHLVYRCYAAFLAKESFQEPVRLLRKWCRAQSDAGIPGWEKRFETQLKQIPPARDRRAQESWAEALCDAVPYH